MGTKQTNLLLVADAQILGDDIGIVTAAGYDPVWREDADAALAWLEAEDPGAILLQLRLGDEFRLKVLDAVRKAPGDDTPVIVVARADALDLRVSALNRGADDYLLYPFSTDELLARFATARRRRELRQDRYLRLGDILVDMKTARLGNGVNWTWFSPTEWRVFAALLDRPDETVSKQQLKRVLAGSRPLSDNAVEVMVCRLRTRLGDWGVRIRAIRGIGYILESEPDALAVAS